jgi:hypothetical protein
MTNIPNPAGKGRGRPPMNPADKKLQGIRTYQKSIHQYTELAKTAVSNTELYNLYGIVVDATSPHKKDERGYKTHLKIIDPSL